MKPFDPTLWRNDFSAYIGRSEAADAELERLRAELRERLDDRAVARSGSAWYRSAYAEAFVFMYDTGFYDREAGRYRIDEILDDGERAFGGYDIVLLWQSYPRLGIDGRNQIDLYRDMPGGLPGLRGLTDRAHARGVRVFVNYNPWDIGTRRESGADPTVDPRGYRAGFADAGAPARADAEALAQMIEAIGADGVFLDTMASDDPGFRAPIERANPNIVFDPEGVPPLEALGSVAGSWLQRKAVEPPELLTIRWLEPRFSFRAIDRDSLDRSDLIQRAFFHGCGQVIWENIFGWWNPWPEADRTLLRRCVRLLRAYAEAFHDPGWKPYVATRAEGVFAHRWQVDDTTVHTLLNASEAPVDGPVLAVPAEAQDGRELRHYDVWNGVEIRAEVQGGSHLLRLTMRTGEAGCIVSVPLGGATPDLGVAETAPGAGEAVARERVTLADLSLRPVAPSAPVTAGERPTDMCHVPGGSYSFIVRHNTAAVVEGACYGGVDRLQNKHHPAQRFELTDLWIDRTEVTNAAYHSFVEATRHTPRDLTNYLRHWQRPPGREHEPWTWSPPPGKERHPVVWVDLDDARAYARWAGKRLPREEEWQRAAGSTLWPWGDRFDPNLCNSGSDDTTPVDRFPGGASSAGLLDMAGNVWEWTESERDDGHTRYAIVRGGSYLLVEGSKWYCASGAQPNDCHEKVLLMYPGLDRCATIGFRCVRDIG
jgi:formylglycine-generating enzyme required for sulfatase activity